MKKREKSQRIHHFWKRPENRFIILKPGKQRKRIKHTYVSPEELCFSLVIKYSMRESPSENYN